MPDARKFVVGDVVHLKSGGPSMTVVRVSEVTEDLLECTWFGQHEVFRSVFPSSALKRVAEKESVHV